MGHQGSFIPLVFLLLLSAVSETGSHYVTQTHGEPPSSTSPVLRFQECTTTSSILPHTANVRLRSSTWLPTLAPLLLYSILQTLFLSLCPKQPAGSPRPRKWRCFWNFCLTWGLVSQYHSPMTLTPGNSYGSITKGQITHWKRTYHLNRYTNGPSAHEYKLNIIRPQGAAYQKHNEKPLPIHRNDYHQPDR